MSAAQDFASTLATGILIFLPYRSWVEFAFAAGARPFLLLFQYVRALFEWGHPLPMWPGASSTSADLIESTTWVKFKQAETASLWQPHYSTLRTHSRMDCDSAPDKCWKGMKSNKRLYFWGDYRTSLRVLEVRNPTLVRVPPGLEPRSSSAVMEWHFPVWDL